MSPASSGPAEIQAREAKADLFACRIMAIYLEKELDLLAPGCASLAKLLHSAISSEIKMRNKPSIRVVHIKRDGEDNGSVRGVKPLVV
jgi:hypothetical protein